MTEPIYSIRGNAVVFKTSAFSREVILCIPDLKQAIENIKTTRDDYKMEEAHQNTLSIYEGALEFAEANGLCQSS